MGHFFEAIPGWFHHAAAMAELINHVPDNGKIVEVGSWKGKSAAFIAVEIIRQDRGLHLTCIDTWEGSDEKVHQEDRDVQEGILFQRFEENIAEVSHVITAMREESPFAAQFFDNGSIDLLYLDAAHDYDSVRDDITAWWPKITAGGYIIGDDYKWPGVKRAVDEAFGAHAAIVGVYPAWIVKKGAEHGLGHSAEENGGSKQA